jgi:hypothetical protein
MDLNKMLSELRSYRAAIDQAILALEGLASGARRGPGRPRKWMTSVANRNETSAKKPRKFSAEARRRMAEGQRKRWAAARTKRTSPGKVA